MNSNSSSRRNRRITRRGHSLRVIALMAIAVSALAAGCIQNHDPRTDSSRADSHSLPAMGATSQRAG
jgi:hypothetical protein